MTGRERFLTAIANHKPDRLPCQVHSWMQHYLKTILGGCDQYQAYEFFDMDPVIYVDPIPVYNQKDLANWEITYKQGGMDKAGKTNWERIIATPDGILTEKGSFNTFTGWTTDHLIKNERDFELWNQYVPVPETMDQTPVVEAKKRIGERGIVRGSFFDFGQGSPWQSYATILHGTQTSIMESFDEPDWLHAALQSMLEKKLRVIERSGKIELDLVETGGGGGSSTVISPAMFQEFCLPYDKIQHAAIHAAGSKIVYHLCGGLMPMLGLVAASGADGLETMTPPEMGGDCDLAEANRRVGDKLFFIGGFDQNAGFEQGSPDSVRDQVHRLFAACPAGGYIMSPSDHFFFGDPDNIHAFVKAARECTY